MRTFNRCVNCVETSWNDSITPIKVYPNQIKLCRNAIFPAISTAIDAFICKNSTAHLLVSFAMLTVCIYFIAHKGKNHSYNSIKRCNEWARWTHGTPRMCWTYYLKKKKILEMCLVIQCYYAAQQTLSYYTYTKAWNTDFLWFTFSEATTKNRFSAQQKNGKFSLFLVNSWFTVLKLVHPYFMPWYIPQ